MPKHPERPLPSPIPEGTIAALRAALSDPWRKPLPRMLREVAQAAVRARSLPGYYFKHLLYRTDAGDARGYLTRREVRRIKSFVRDNARVPFLENKLLFHHHFRSADVELPGLLGYNVGPAFFSEGASHPLDSADDFLRLAESLVSRSGSAAVFVKPMGGTHGKGSFKLDSASLPPERVETYHAQVCSGSFLFEEAVVQHPLLSAIHPFSVNTLRVITYVRKDEAVEVVSALLRMGANRSRTDNGSAGGLFARVDLDSGSLAPYARRLREFGGTVHFTHPDTGFEFSGCVLPDFDSAVQVARAAAAHLPYRLVGWDVAITLGGPVLIEGNHRPHIFASEIADGGYRKNPVFRALLEEVGVF
jgi:hypothetical protein